MIQQIHQGARERLKCLILRFPRRRFLSPLMLVFLLSLAHADPATSDYVLLKIQTFDVYVNKEMSANPQLLQKTLYRLQEKLKEINSLMTPEQLTLLKKVHFWVEKANSQGAAEFHYSREWLIEHGRNPDKEHGIEISNAQNFLDWSAQDQPMMILHELSHAYLVLALGADYGPLQAAWENAVNKHLYESVDYVHGGPRKAYALTDKNEFFAELSEAFFGKNDFFPYTADDLKSYDPAGYQLMEAAWGKRAQ